MSSFEHHEYESSNNEGVNTLITELGGNDNKFKEHLNQAFDSFLSNEKYKERHEMCKNSRNSSDFYKFLVLCKRGQISEDIQSTVSFYLGNISYNEDGINDIDEHINNLLSIYNNYILFDFHDDRWPDDRRWTDNNINKSDYSKFLRSSVVSMLLKSSYSYDNSFLRLFCNYNWPKLRDIYKKVNKSKNKFQSWDDFFSNNGQDTVINIQGLYDNYITSEAGKETRNSLDITKKKADIKDLIEKKLAISDDNFSWYLADILNELGDDKYLDGGFLQSLFLGSNSVGRYCNIYKIHEYFNQGNLYISHAKTEKEKKQREEKFNGYKANLKRDLLEFIPKFHSSYSEKGYSPLVFMFGVPHEFYGEVPLQLSYEQAQDTTLSTYTTDIRNTGYDVVSLFSKRRESTFGTSPNKPQQPINEAKKHTPEVQQPAPELKDIFEIVKGSAQFRVLKDKLQNIGMTTIDDESIIYTMFYSCSISDTKNTQQKATAIDILNKNPRFNEIGKEIWENVIVKFMEFDAGNITLESKYNQIGETLVTLAVPEVQEFNKIFIDAQSTLKQKTDVDDIKNTCISIVSQIKSKEKEYTNYEGFISEKINILIPAYLNLKKLTGNDDYNTRGLFILYNMLTDSKDIGIINNANIDRIINGTYGDPDSTSGESSKFKAHRQNNSEAYHEQMQRRIDSYNREVQEYNNTLIARYEAAQSLAESKRFYDSDVIRGFFPSDSNPDDPSGLQVASKIDDVSNKLNSYRIKTDRSEHEEAALKYTSFDITFNNTFNLSNNSIVQKLGHLNIDLRSEMSSYGFYNQESNTFNEDAWNKFVNEKLQNAGNSPEEKLTAEEIDNLKKSFEGLPAEVEKNYEVLCGNFETDQSSFEKIAKVYALGEIIDNIKSLFSGLDSKRIGDFMGLELDAKEPADIKGDCLFIKGTINGTETNIKYDLRTGKLYMNSFTEQTFNPPKIVIGNTEPTTEIGDLGSFEDMINNLNNPFVQENGDNEQNSEQSSEQASRQVQGEPSQNENGSEEGKEGASGLIKKKLNEDLKKIGDIVNEKAGEQGKENNVIDELLKTFNILPDSSDSGESKSLEFMGGSKLFTLIESIKNTNDESELVEFSNQMKELMSLCELSWGKNNENPNQGDFTSISIFNIDENNATTDIISLQQASQRFFSQDSGEKDRIKDSESHFDSSIQLSFANIIVQKCCEDSGDGRKISANKLKSFVTSVKDGVSNIKSDNDEVLAMESMFEDDVSLA